MVEELSAFAPAWRRLCEGRSMLKGFDAIQEGLYGKDGSFALFGFEIVKQKGVLFGITILKGGDCASKVGFIPSIKGRDRFFVGGRVGCGFGLIVRGKLVQKLPTFLMVFGGIADIFEMPHDHRVATKRHQKSKGAFGGFFELVAGKQRRRERCRRGSSSRDRHRRRSRRDRHRRRSVRRNIARRHRYCGLCRLFARRIKQLLIPSRNNALRPITKQRPSFHHEVVGKIGPTPRTQAPCREADAMWVVGVDEQTMLWITRRI